MCVVSMIVDHYRDKWHPLVPQPWPYQVPYVPAQPFTPPTPEEQQRQLEQFLNKPKPISDEEIAEFRRLLERAREYDARNNEPECEMDEKKQALQEIARQLGVDISFL